MKKTAVIVVVAALLPVLTYGQKKMLDHSVYDSWQSSAINKLSNDGSILAYSVNPQAGDGTLYIRRMDDGCSLAIPRGTGFTMTEDSKWATVTIKAPYDSTRNAKIAKKKKEQMPKDTVAYIDLGKLEIHKHPEADALRMGSAAAPFIIGSKEAPGKKGISNLVVLNPANGVTDTLLNIASFTVSRQGDKMAMITNKDKKDSLSLNAVILRDLTTGCSDTLSRDKKSYKGLSFNHDGDKLLFLASDEESNHVGTVSYSLILTERKVTAKASRKKTEVAKLVTNELICEEYDGFPEGWVLDEKAGARFSNSGKRIIFALHPRIPAKDSTVIDFEAAKLDIWRWDSYTIPPLERRGGLKPDLTCIANLHDGGAEVLVLSKSPYDRIQFILGADNDIALSKDCETYFTASQWDYNSNADTEIINLNDGSRRFVGKCLPSPALSNFGKYVTWFDRNDGNWYSWSVDKGETVNLTGGLGVSFVYTDWDTPGEIAPYSSPWWFGEDEQMLLSDRFDIWKLTPDGKKNQNLTAGKGRADSIQFRVTEFEVRDHSHLYQNVRKRPLKGEVYLTAFNEKDKTNGLASLNLESPGEPRVMLDTFSFSAWTKAVGSDKIVFRRGNFTTAADICVSKVWQDGQTSLADCEHLTSVNPQKEDYLWGHARLVSWDAYDGTPLKGILYTPENLDTEGKYPMIVYFYEKNSQNLYSSYSPAPSRSVVNFPLYVSRGYVVFIPDIVYTTGHPGESAYNCIVSGTEAMCSQFPFIDRDRMGLQGQSWGGYQTTYLVTRTNLYAAAEAGAPVANMTSAYGGIRWGTGNSRIGQYENGQSRIGKNLWEEGALDLYIENSPVFFADHVQTPLMIMSNDGDGAVPWYQGIEMFMSLRRLDKPCWLLQYNGEAHNLVKRENCKDLSIRMLQFFDHYLKGEPMPFWMSNDIPLSLKGNMFGY